MIESCPDGHRGEGFEPRITRITRIDSIFGHWYLSHEFHELVPPYSLGFGIWSLGFANTGIHSYSFDKLRTGSVHPY